MSSDRVTGVVDADVDTAAQQPNLTTPAPRSDRNPTDQSQRSRFRTAIDTPMG
jgi:hypothetical protein